jgi:hypothetical protein
MQTDNQHISSAECRLIISNSIVCRRQLIENDVSFADKEKLGLSAGAGADEDLMQHLSCPQTVN